MTTDGPQEPPRPKEVRLSIMEGDRLCARCGFNLAGQTIVRDPVYDMPMVRCPECSAVAALQEYPALGKWASRIAAIVAAAYFVIIMAGVFATAGAIFGFSMGVNESAGGSLAVSIAEAHNMWVKEDQNKAVFDKLRSFSGGQPNLVTNAYSYIDSTWWASQDQTAFLHKSGGFFVVLGRDALTVLAWGCFVAFLIGAAWSVLLIGLKRRRLIAVGLIAVLIASFFALMSHDTSRYSHWMGSFIPAHEAARQLTFWRNISFCFATLFVSLCIGMQLGRPLVRWLIALLLPPRSASALSILWMAEGKLPPKPKRPTTASSS